MSFVGSNILAGASGQGGGGYAIERSLRFNSGDSAYLSRNFAASNRKTWTWSGWFKLSKLGQRNYIFTNWNSSGMSSLYLEWTNLDTIRVGEYSGSAWEWRLDSISQFRDPSAWYHLVVAIDTTQSTASDRVKVYINGEQLTSFSPSDYPNQNKDTYVNQAVEHNIGRLQTTEADFYLADVHFIDGQALAPTDFGETDDNGVWQPKEFEGAYSQAASGTTTALSQTGWLTSGGNSQSSIWDGNTSTQANGHNGGIIGTVTFNPPLTNVTKVELYTQNYHHYLNGSQITTSESSTEWHTYYDNSGSPITLNSVGNSYTNNTQTVDLMAIRINGSIIDSQNWTPPSGIGLQGTGDNSFHLPFTDNSSNAALGTDTSGNSNTWTVNNLEAAPGGGTPVSSATGALPVYNTTDSLGKVKGTGTRTDSNSSYLVVAVPFDAGNTVDVSNSINTSSTTKSFTTTGSFASNASNIFYGSSTDFNGSSVLGTTSSSSDFTFGTGDFTIEYWANYDDISASNSQRGDFQTSTTSGGVVTTLSTGVINSFYPSGTLNFNVAGVGAGVIAGLAAGTWYHIAFVRENGSVRLYKDGILQATTSNTGNVTATYLAIGGYYSATYFINGRMQDFRVYKGVAKYTSNFTLVAPGNPALKAGTDSLVDTPTNGDTASDTGAGGEVVGNYATLNPLYTSVAALSNGNLLYGGGSGQHCVGSTLAVKSGKWYWESTVESGGTYYYTGIADSNTAFSTNWCGSSTGWSVSVNTSGNISHNNTENHGNIGTSPSTGQVWGWALDMDAGTLKVYINGVIQYSGNSIIPSSTSLSGRTVTPATGHTTGKHLTYNFGQRAFHTAAPAGFLALCTANLPEPTIADGSTAFATKLWTGNGGTMNVTGLNNSPDLVWYKSRSASGYHFLVDTIRGVNKSLHSNASDAELSQTGLTSFNSDGYTLGPNTTIGNTNGESYVGWSWDAGSSNTTIAAGGLNSSVYDQSQTWSGLWTGTAGYGSFANLHDADITNYVQSLNGTLTFSSAIAVTSIRIYANRYGANATLSINGTDVTSQLAAAGSGLQWNTITGFTSVTSIAVTGADYSSNLIGLYAIELSGKLLVDSGVSVPNVPSIASTVRANPSAGFSIVTYTGNATAGATVGHALNAQPHMTIHKNRDSSANGWLTQHISCGLGSGRLFLNTTGATSPGGSTAYWNDTAPDSNVFTLGSNAEGNGTSDYLALCFAPIEGYSAMGSYEGNGSTDGPFVFTGFKPKWILIKNVDNSGTGYDWHINDAERDPINVSDSYLNANTSSSEQTYAVIDFLSNGFKLRNSGGSYNLNAHTHIYLAFAEHPFKTARSR